MFQIAYFSTAATQQEATVIQRILLTSRKNNLRDDISGLLVAGGNRYLQVIEGPRREMEVLYAIRADDRHIAVTTLVERTTLKRCFEGWTMAYRREPALGEFDSFPAVLRHLTEQVEDERLRGQIRQFAAIFIAGPASDGRDLWKLAS
ncbi:BLUF domain-containing protein [Sphingomonas sp.]|uniref:BLUF domain-containing protein n=1 Tax=Sphingomonas sp. TaxID=28214 RepID=UPI00286DB411|nr:BLUF domain-containing protein [Sphingomonas sp.]